MRLTKKYRLKFITSFVGGGEEILKKEYDIKRDKRFKILSKTSEIIKYLESKGYTITEI